MKKKLILIAITIVVTGILMTNACKKKSEPAPVADFGLNLLKIYEGDTIVFTNKSTNSKSFKWSYSGSKWTSTDANPSMVVDSAGSFKVMLEATNGDGKTNTKSMDIQVMPDTIWRISGNKKKEWWTKSISYNGSEMLTASCQLDDEFTVFKYANSANDSCLLTEGTNKCPSGTYLITLPTSSKWRLYKGKFEFALSVLGTPFNLSFDLTKCTNYELQGVDNVNKVSIRLVKK
jgi:PKD repeat protein